MKKVNSINKVIALITSIVIVSSTFFVFDVFADNTISPTVDGKNYIYEVEKGTLVKNAYVNTSIKNYSGNGYVNILDAGSGVTMNITVQEAGNYRVKIYSCNDDGNNKCDYFSVNNGTNYLVATPASANKTWYSSEPGTENWENDVLKPKPLENGFSFNAGTNTIKITVNWGYSYYDKIVLEKIGPDEATKNVIDKISALPEKVTESARTQIESAKAAYDALNENQKSDVTNYSVLETKLSILNPEIQKAVNENGTLIYETEVCSYPNVSAFTDTTIKGYSGTGYVYLMEGTIRVRIDIPEAGNYFMYVYSANTDGGNKCDKVTINDDKTYLVSTQSNSKNKWSLNAVGTENWENDQLKPLAPKEGFSFKKGINTVEISANWGYCAYDKIVLVPVNSNVAADSISVSELNKAIEKLPSVIMPDNIDDVMKAYDLYNLLNEKDKSFVQDINKLYRSIAMVNALKADKNIYKGTMRYECESGKMIGNSSIVNEKSVFSTFSGDGYVFLFDKSFDVDVYVEKSGFYHINVISGADTNSNKCDYFQVNNGEKYLISTNGKKGEWKNSSPGTEYWSNGVLTPQAPVKGYYLNAGKNTITISANWGYCSYDAIEIYPEGVSPKTGYNDDINIAVTVFVMLVSFGGLIVISKVLKA